MTTFKEEIRTALNGSLSMTGMGRIVEPGVHPLRRTIWTILVLSAFGFLCYQIVFRVLFYLTNPVRTVIEWESNDNTPFPTLTICDLDAVEAVFTVKESLMFDRSCHIKTMGQSLLPKKIPCNTGGQNSSNLSSRPDPPKFHPNVTWLPRLGVKAGESYIFAEKIDHIYPIVGRHCLRFNAEPHVDNATGIGERHSYNIRFSVDKDVLQNHRAGIQRVRQNPDAMSNYFGEKYHDLEVVLHSNNSALQPASFKMPLFARFGNIYTLRGFREVTTHVKNCTDVRTKVKFDQAYSKEACIVDLVTSKMYDLCDCVILAAMELMRSLDYIPLQNINKSDVCEKLNIEDAAKALCLKKELLNIQSQLDRSSCKPSCKSETFINEVFVEPLPDAPDLNNRNHTRSFLEIRIQMSSLETKFVKEELIFSELLDYASDLGGTMGVMIGGCLFLFLELLDVICVVLITLLCKSNSKSDEPERNDQAEESTTNTFANQHHPWNNNDNMGHHHNGVKIPHQVAPDTSNPVRKY